MKGSLFDESSGKFEDSEDGGELEESCGVCGDWKLEHGWGCRDRRQGCADGCVTDTRAEMAGAKDGDDRKLEAMELDW